MSDSTLHAQLEQTLAELGVAAETLEELASNLLWRIGKANDDGPVTVRVGLASSAELFQSLQRLRGAADAEIEDAVRDGTVRVEWVGPRPRGER